MTMSKDNKWMILLLLKMILLLLKLKDNKLFP